MARRKQKRQKQFDQEMWMLTNHGIVQFLEQQGFRGTMLARDHAGARRLATFFAEQKGITCTPAKIGSIEGETLVGQLYASVNHGCNCAFVLTNFNRNNEPEFMAVPIKP